jgi:hypothetical protein
MADNPRYTVTISPKRGGVPIGGTTGQVLTKIDNTDWNSSWQTATSGGASSFSQLTGTLALSQTSMNTNKLLGRGTAGVGVFEEITLGTNLSLTGTTLNATGGGGSVLTGKNLYVDGTNGNDGTGVRGDLTKPYLTIAAAVAAASSGDIVQVGPGTFAQGATALQLPANVSLSGSGIGVTTITSTVSTTTHACLIPGTGSVVSDLTVSGNSALSPPLGIGTSDTVFTNAILFRVSAINTGGDAFHFGNAGTYSLKAYDCIGSGATDCLYPGTGTSDLEFWNCSFSTDGGSSNDSIGVLCGSGTTRLFNCKITTANAGAGSKNYSLWAGGGNLEAHNVRIKRDASGLSPFDLFRNSGTLSVENISRDDGAALTTSGTFTQLSRYASRDTDLSQFAATTSLQLKGVISDETGSGALVFGTSPAITTPTGIVSSDVGLGNVTNNAQTQAAIVPNTAPTAGQILVGNAGNTAYAKQTLSGSGATATLGATGVLTLSAIPNATLSNSAITIAGTSTSLGGSITLDTITGVASNGFIKRTGANTLTNSVFGTNVETFLGTPSSANLRAALTDENGTGAALFDSSTSATFITPILGTPTSGNLANCTGYKFTSLSDTAGAYAGNAGKAIRVNAGESALEYFSAAGSGTVTNIATTSPITGGPITTTGTIALDVSVDHAFTATQSIFLNNGVQGSITDALSISHDTTGTPANGIGVGVSFSGETSTTVDQSIGKISAVWSDVTHATRTGYFTFQLTNSGTPGTAMRLFASGGLSVNNTTDPGAGIISANTGYRVGTAGSTSGTILKSDGSKFIASTETYAAPGTSGNVLTSDGTNWTSAAPTGGGSAAPIYNQNYGVAYTVPDTGELFQPDRSTISSTNRATIAGTGRTVVYDQQNNPPRKSSSSPGSFIIKSGEGIFQFLRMIFSGSSRATMTENARIVVTDLTPGCRLVLAGGPS